MTNTWVLAAAILGSSMTFIDGTAVNVALPLVQADFHASASDVQWVVEGYALLLSSLILIGGSLGDIFGRRLIFMAGVVAFAVASFACAFATTMPWLIAARCVQGAGAALAMPGSLALISASYTGTERGRAIGTWSGFASITAAAGPLAGGLLAQHFSWRYVFLINLPLAALVVIIALLCVPESRDEGASFTVDWTGALLGTFGLGLLVYGLIRLQSGRADAAGVAAAVTGTLALAAFIACERRARAPMMPLRLFRSRAFSAANVYTFFLYAALGGSLYFVPFVLIDVQRYSPSAAGAALLPFVIIQFALSRWSGGLVARIGPRVPLVAGAVAAAAAFALFARPGVGGSYWTTYFPASFVLGIAGALFVAPLTTTVLDAVEREHSGIASGINNAVARTAGLLAIAALGIALSAVFARGFDARIARTGATPQTRAIAAADRTKLTAGTVPSDIPAGDRAKVESAVRAGFIDGFRVVMLLGSGVSLMAAVVAFAWIPRKIRTPQRV
ncbi:MAG: MFS transporter [Candidatus Velthaea sp.]